MTLNLMTSLGDKRVEIDDSAMLAEPVAMGVKHHPMSHREFFDTVEEQLELMGLTMRQHVHALSGKEGERYFGMAEIESTSGEHASVIGWRSTHDQRYAASLVGGSGVFVCSNLCFSGEVKVSTRHTTNMRDRLPQLIRSAAVETRLATARQITMFDLMKQHQLDTPGAHDAMIRMVKAGIVLPSRLETVINAYETPPHVEFEEDGYSWWRLFNAVTESFKPASSRADNIPLLIERSPRLVDFVEAELI